MHSSVLWAEDLEGHRQPALYYLSDEEGADGPHLICDWNGAPTDYSETDFDALTLFKEHEEATDTSPITESIQKGKTEDEFIDYPNPAADITGTAPNGESKSRPTCRQNDLDFNECRNLDFLSVPPMTGGLIQRYVRWLVDLRSKYNPHDNQQKLHHEQPHQQKHHNHHHKDKQKERESKY